METQLGNKKEEYVNPPMNYTGSKFKLLEQILPEFDYTKPYFVDLFMGGGSVYTNVVDKYENPVEMLHINILPFLQLHALMVLLEYLEIPLHLFL